MANTKASKKGILTSARNHERNLHYRSRMKSTLKRAVAAIETKAENRQDIVREALQIIDVTVSKGVIKKQTGSRKKSRLAIALNKSLAA